jgi:arylsulfatase A-like enzyme
MKTVYRRRPRRRDGRILLLSALLLLRAGYTKAQKMQDTPLLMIDGKPNIVFIIGESHRAEALGVAGNPFVQTPHLDQLARSGILFSHAYVTTAISSVSRAGMLTGQHRARHGINDFQTNFTPEALQETLPMVMKANGYTIALIGAYGVGNNPPKDSFDCWENVPWMTEDGVHNTDQIVRLAGDWLDHYSDMRPFYLNLSFDAAHEIDPTADAPAHYLIQDRYKNLYDDMEIPQPKTADASYWNVFPDFFRTDRNIARSRWNGFFSSDELFQQNAKDYYRLLTGVDEAVGKIREKLEALGLANNTIIIYTSDHGFSLGEHGLMGKWYGFDVGIHVPLIIYDPRCSALRDVENASIALNIDIAPTILSLAGVTPPACMQGVNLMDLASNKIEGRNSFFYEHTVFGSPSLPDVEGVVTKTVKYMKYIEHDYEELYDLVKDPDESVNVAADPVYSEALAEMRRLYAIEKEKAQ